MEGIAFPGTRKTVHRFIDHPGLCNTAQLLDVGECPVVRRHHILTALCPRHNASSGGTYSRIHNGYKNRTLRPIAHGLDQTVGSLPNVILRNFMRQIGNLQIPAYGICHSIHGAHGSVGPPEIRLKNKWIHTIILSPFNLGLFLMVTDSSGGVHVILLSPPDWNNPPAHLT